MPAGTSRSGARGSFGCLILTIGILSTAVQARKADNRGKRDDTGADACRDSGHVHPP